MKRQTRSRWQHECTVPEGMRQLLLLLPRVMHGLRRRSDVTATSVECTLGSRHASALSLLQDDQLTVGCLAGRLGLTLATASGIVAELERVGFVQRRSDPADRRRTIVTIVPEQRATVEEWLRAAAGPIVRVLEQLSPEERASFVKAMDLLETELEATPKM
ncbi:MarR family transcriptional regulator [Frankia sp. Cppng1_Ct_nod]|uniref:MarR family winged helix-turn-helix transcriptional regulator n=1 Tax=Frankia sp. Cppng1_Ct_nod TaxID=2897162 RepID=UPI0020243888|nr:MarR family transcriptional regulator [Frankia sp. Cppng1_Ct_nod]